MNEDIIKWSREAGWSGIYTQWISDTEHKTLPIPMTMEELSRFAALVRADEREACAKVAMLVAVNGIETSAAIRARSQA